MLTENQIRQSEDQSKLSNQVGMISQAVNTHTQSIKNLEVQIGQMAETLSKREYGKLPSQPENNPQRNAKGKETVQAVTLRSGKNLSSPPIPTPSITPPQSQI